GIGDRHGAVEGSAGAFEVPAGGGEQPAPLRGLGRTGHSTARSNRPPEAAGAVTGTRRVSGEPKARARVPSKSAVICEPFQARRTVATVPSAVECDRS